MRRTLVSVLVAATMVGCGGSSAEDDSSTGAATPSGPSSEATVMPTTDTPTSDAVAPDPTEAETIVTEASEASGAGSGQASAPPDLNTAVVTVGDQTVAFEWEPSDTYLCDPDMFGGFVAVAQNPTDQTYFELELFPEDLGLDQPPKIELDPMTGAYWTANPEENIGQTVADWPAQINDFSLDGATASGTATFVNASNIGDTLEIAEGSFEVTCAPTE